MTGKRKTDPILCRFHGTPINQDRFNIGLELERQDFPGKSEWQKSTEFYLENVCPKCYSTLNNVFRFVVKKLMEDKGEWK